MRKTTLAALALVSLLISACAPVLSSPTPKTIDNSRLVKAPALFYPERHGFQWQYANENGGETTATLTGLKRFPLDNQAYETLTSVDADGTTTVKYLKRENGIQLVGEVRDDQYLLHYDPPLRLYPTERAFRIGAEWGGTTHVTEIMGYGTNTETRLPWTVTYNHQVIERENIRAGSNIYDAYKLRYTADWTTEHAILGQNTVTEVWFAPFAGEIRTREGHALTDTNINTTFHDRTAPNL